MAEVVERQPGEAGLLSKYRVSGPTKERTLGGKYSKPTTEVERGDLAFIVANGEIVVALISEVLDDHFTSSIVYLVNVIMHDGTLGRPRTIRKTKDGFLDCFMPDWEPEWLDVDYDSL